MFGSAINKKKKEDENNININNNEFNTEDDLNNMNNIGTKNILNNSFGDMNNNMKIEVCEDSTTSVTLSSRKYLKNLSADNSVGLSMLPKIK